MGRAAAALHRIVVEPGGQSSSERPIARTGAQPAALDGAVTAVLDYVGDRTSATAAATRSTASGGIRYQSGSRTS
jgi:hypothetical protein